jgi:dynein heavy chain
LYSLRKSDIDELKSLRSPPPLVRFVMEAVNIMFGLPAEWHYSRRLLLKEDFLARLLQFDKDNMSEATLDRLERYVRDLGVSAAKVARSSKACYAVWIYVVAMYQYGVYCREISARRARLRQEARKGNLSGNVAS